MWLRSFLIARDIGGLHRLKIDGLDYPEDRYYFVISPLHLWIKEKDSENLYEIGFTAFLLHYIKQVRTISTRRSGQSLPKGKTLLSIDSGEYVIPMALPVPVSVREINQELKKDPKQLSKSPYNYWLYVLEIKSDDLSKLAEQSYLVKPGKLLEEFILKEKQSEALEKYNCCPKAFSTGGVVRRKRKRISTTEKK